MKKTLFAVLAAVMMTDAAMAASSTPSKTFQAITQLRKESENNRRVFELAERDAAEFTFSDGAVRGEDLKRALALIRRERPRLQSSDMDLSIAILQAE